MDIQKIVDNIIGKKIKKVSQNENKKWMVIQVSSIKDPYVDYLVLNTNVLSDKKKLKELNFEGLIEIDITKEKAKKLANEYLDIAKM